MKPERSRPNPTAPPAFRARRLIVALVALTLIVLGQPLTAHAALTTPVTITINELKCGSACDEQGIEGIGEGTPDWFVKVFIDGQEFRKDGPDDTPSLTPKDWAFTKVVPATQDSVSVRIQTWDRDKWSDDLADDTPQKGDKSLDFKVDLGRVAVTGDEISGGIGQKLCTFGNGEDADGSAWICFTADTGDRDGDGLLDTWETNGIDYDGNGTIDLFLNRPPFNANPDRKDIFVEVDYMSCAAGGCAPGDAHSHQPQAQALQDVVDAFANAPVHNPTGPDGITLHAMLDEPIAERNQVLFKTDGPGANDDFNDIKNGNPAGPCTGSFGTPAERSAPDCANVLLAKRAVFQYLIFGHAYTENPKSSGISELDPKGGNDFMVTLGNWGAGSIAANGGQRVSEAGTMMHELGHNLSLRHGGFEDGNCKPNYLSVMNYALQFQDFDNVRPLDYSRRELPPLDETNLPTTGGVGDSSGRNTVFGRGGVGQVAPAGGPINWDGKGGNTGDVNFIQKINDCSKPSPGDKQLKGYDDWQNLVYNFRGSPMFNDGAVRTTPVDELTADEAIAVIPDVDLNTTKVADKTTALPGDTVNYTVTATNAGPGRGYGVKVVDTLPDGSSVERSVGELTAGTSNVQQFSYAIPCTAADGSVVTNTATVSGTNKALVNDVNLANNTAQASTTVRAPKVALAKSATATANSGDAITYTLTYENTGGGDAANTVIVDTLPADVYYSLALDQGAGPKPDSVVSNPDGSTTLTWHVGTVAGASGPKAITYTARTSLLTLGGSSVRNSATISYGNANGCAYTGDGASAATAVTEAPATKDPHTLGYWRNHSAEWTAEVLARIQATDQRFDGADGSAPDGVLSAAEVNAVLSPNGGIPRVTVQQLVATYFNLATHRISASTAISSTTDTRLGLTNVRGGVLYGRATLALPVNTSTQDRYSDTTTVLDEINMNRSEVY